MKKLRAALSAIVDLISAPLTLISALWLKTVRRARIERFKIAHKIFNWVGVFPVRDHYYEPLFNPKHLKRPLDHDRPLPGIDLNVPRQLAILEEFHFQDELLQFPYEKAEEEQFYYGNPNLGPGDSEYLYSLLRLYKPRTLIEVGSGYSTLIARAALAQNSNEAANYTCRHVCIEPYEMIWLERQAGIEVIRSRVEDLPPDFFAVLEANDVLFIDSSHVIRPQGDVLYNILQVLPLLRSGVLVHLHDIFTPADYPRDWVVNKVRLWNEQYLLEAFLSCNHEFEVIGALSFLSRRHPEKLAERLPIFRQHIGSARPGSFWIRKI